MKKQKPARDKIDGQQNVAEDNAGDSLMERSDMNFSGVMFN